MYVYIYIFIHILNQWTMKITILMCLQILTYVSSGYVFINWIFSLWFMFSWFFSYLVILIRCKTLWILSWFEMVSFSHFENFRNFVRVPDSINLLGIGWSLMVLIFCNVFTQIQNSHYSTAISYYLDRTIFYLMFHKLWDFPAWLVRTDATLFEHWTLFILILWIFFCKIYLSKAVRGKCMHALITAI